jgi:Peptidase family M23
MVAVVALAVMIGGWAGAASNEGAGGDQLTPIVLQVANRPIPVLGSDGRHHIVYELYVTNFTGGRATIQRVDVLDAEHDRVLQSLGGDQIAARFVVRDPSAAPGILGPAQFGILYLHLALGEDVAVPTRLTHRLLVLAEAVGQNPVSETGGRTGVAPPTDLVLDPPLRGTGFIAGDGCCDAPRHIRATLPINGRPFLAQRFAIDWEQVNADNRIVVGDRKQPSSYVIYGAPVFAVASARVVAAVDGLPDSPPGQLPPNIPLSQADGNHVILDLEDGRFALYAHLKPGSVQVQAGARVQRGQLLGVVGTSGNSSEPHLHFQVMDGPSALTANGVPYVLRHFRAVRKGASTAAFDRATMTGEPLAVEPVDGGPLRAHVLPVDLWIVDFPSP